MAEMNHLDHVRVARRRSHMVVIPPVHRRCRTRGDDRRTLFYRPTVHDPPR
jgi:hypothetical protein